MATVAFVVNRERPAAEELAERATRWLAARDHRALRVHDDAAATAGVLGEVRPEPAPDAQLDGVDLAVSLGGDGTMLRTVSVAAAGNVPVLGVNLGRLGYLTEVEPAGLEGALQQFVDGAYRLQERMMLQVTVRRRSEPDVAPSYVALNEMVVEKTVPGHTVRLSAAIAGRPFITYAADGLLVSTPTGSTAYNLSARGPILSPQLRALVVTPISPHMLFDRPLVLDASESVTLTVAGPRPAVLVVDGLSGGMLEPGDMVECGAAARCARLVTFGHHHFHAVLKARFHLADR